MTYVLVFRNSIVLISGDVPKSMVGGDAQEATPTTGNINTVEKFDLASVGLVEIIYTYVICLVVIRAVVKARQIQSENESFGMAIGGVIVAGGYAGKWISGACFNPAVAIGIDMSAGFLSKVPAHGGISGRCFLYAIMELIAGLW